MVEPFKSFIAFCLCLDLALPYTYHFPPAKPQIDRVDVVAGIVNGNLVFPESSVGLGQPVIFASYVTMPEATVDEYDRLVLFQDYVGRTGQFAVVHSIAQPFCEQETPHCHLRFGVLALDGRHAAAPLLRCHHVSHIRLSFHAIKPSVPDGGRMRWVSWSRQFPPGCRRP